MTTSGANRTRVLNCQKDIIFRLTFKHGEMMRNKESTAFISWAYSFVKNRVLKVAFISDMSADKGDLAQILMADLIKWVKKYKKNKNCLFITYLSRCCNNKIRNYFRDSGRKKRNAEFEDVDIDRLVLQEEGGEEGGEVRRIF